MQDKEEDAVTVDDMERMIEKSKCTYQQQTIEDECFCTWVNTVRTNILSLKHTTDKGLW